MSYKNQYYNLSLEISAGTQREGDEIKKPHLQNHVENIIIWNQAA